MTQEAAEEVAVCGEIIFGANIETIAWMKRQFLYEARTAVAHDVRIATFLKVEYHFVFVCDSARCFQCGASAVNVPENPTFCSFAEAKKPETSREWWAHTSVRPNQCVPSALLRRASYQMWVCCLLPALPRVLQTETEKNKKLILFESRKW